MTKAIKIILITIVSLLLVTCAAMGWYIYANWDKINKVINTQQQDNNPDNSTTISYKPLGKELYKEIPASERIQHNDSLEDDMFKIINDFYKARIAKNTTKANSYLHSNLVDQLKEKEQGTIGVNKSHGWFYTSDKYKTYEIIANRNISEGADTYASYLIQITQTDGKKIDELVTIAQDETGKIEILEITYLYNGTDIVKFYGKLHLVLARADEGNTSVIVATNDFSIGCSSFSGSECQSFKYDKNELSYLTTINNYYYEDFTLLKDRVFISEMSLGDGGSYSTGLNGLNIDTLKSETLAGISGSVFMEVKDLEKVVVDKCKATKQNMGNSSTLEKKGKFFSIEFCYTGNDETTAASNIRAFIVKDKKILEEITLSAAQKKNKDFLIYDPIKDTDPENIFKVKILGVNYTFDITKDTLTKN